MRWVTRCRPKIDRVACPWLVTRFIDSEPEFLFVPSADVLETASTTGALPFDIPGVELSHEGELCSFDAFLKKYQPDDHEMLKAGFSVYDALYTWLRQAKSATHGWPPNA